MGLKVPTSADCALCNAFFPLFGLHSWWGDFSAQAWESQPILYRGAKRVLDGMLDGLNSHVQAVEVTALCRSRSQTQLKACCQSRANFTDHILMVSLFTTNR